MGEFIFIIFLYVFGLVFGLLFQSKKSLAFTLFSSIFWGSLNWVICSIFMVIIIGHLEIAWIIFFIFIELVLIIIYGTLSRRFIITKKSLLFLIIYSIFFVGFDFLFYKINLSVVTPDSLYMIKMSTVILDSGLTDLTWTSPASVGYFVSMMHTPSKYLGVEYLTNLQPMYSINFILLFFVMVFDFLSNLQNKLLRASLSFVFAVFLFCNTMMQFQFSYIHSNFLTGIFLLIAIYSYSKYLSDLDVSWIFFGGLAALAFSLIRTENSIMILIFFTLFLGLSNINYGLRVKYFVPYLILILFFESVLLFIDSPHINEMINQNMIFGFMGLLLVYTKFLLLSRWWVIEKWILPRLHYLFFGLVILIFITLSILFPSQIFVSIDTIFKSLMQYGGWDLTWILIIPITLWLSYCELPIMPNKQETFVKLALPIYLIAILLTGFVDGHPFRSPRWSSSPNRMFAQVLPIIILLLSMTIGKKNKYLNKEPSGE